VTLTILFDRFNYNPRGGAFFDLDFKAQMLDGDMAQVHRGDCKLCALDHRARERQEFKRINDRTFKYRDTEFHENEFVRVYTTGKSGPSQVARFIQFAPRGVRETEPSVQVMLLARMTDIVPSSEMRDQVRSSTFLRYSRSDWSVLAPLGPHE
jgi:hypothetical protein